MRIVPSHLLLLQCFTRTAEQVKDNPSKPPGATPIDGVPAVVEVAEFLVDFDFSGPVRFVDR